VSLPGSAATGALDSIAATRARFALAASAPRLPFVAAAELLSGCDAERTGVRDEATRGLPKGVPTLAGSLGTLGYRGLALPADPLLHAGSGLARGFERYSAQSPALADSARVDSALVWLRLTGKRFVWLDFPAGLPPEVWRRGDGRAREDSVVFTERIAAIREALRRLSRGLDRSGEPTGTAIAVVAMRGAGDDSSASGTLVLAGAIGAALPDSGSIPARLADIAPMLIAGAGGKPRQFDGSNRLANPPQARPAAKPTDDSELRRAFGAGDAAADCRRELLLGLDASGAPDSLAARRFDSLASRCPGSGRIALERAVALSRSGRESDAAREFKTVIGAHPDYPEASIAYADHLIRFQRQELIGAVLAVIPPGSPLAALAAWRSVYALAGQLDFPAAVGEVRRAAALAVIDSSGLGLEPRLIALESLRDGVKRDDRNVAARLSYGRALGEMGLYNAAYEQFHAARSLAPHTAEPDYRLALLLLEQNRPQHAVPTLRRALEHDSTHVPSRLALADALMDLGQRKDARVELERALRQAPGDAREQFNLACLRATDGEAAAALDALERAVSLGYADLARIEGDPDLASLRGEPRYLALAQSVAKRQLR